MNSSRKARVKPVIGIVGGVGAGKSTVASQFVELGCELIDADALGHEVLTQEEVKRELVARWGPGVLMPDGRVDRKAVSRIVFANAEELAALNRITWPRIAAMIERQIAAVRKNAASRAMVLDAAIMMEAGWDRLCTHLVFVRAPQQQRLSRVQSARGWDESQWRNREKSQFSLDTKQSHCYFTIDNSTSISCLFEQTRRTFHEIVHEADASGEPKNR